MKRLALLSLLILTTSGCADPTRVITNKPKSGEQKQKEREQRRQEDEASTEALKNFKITDHAGKKTGQSNQRKEMPPSPMGSKSKPAESGSQTSSALETSSTQPEKK